MAYYNTTNEKGEFLNELWKKASKQEDFVKSLFTEYGNLTASDTWKLFPNNPGYQTPITSVRRAITDLSNQGFLIKTEKKKIGLYGKPEYYYRLLNNELVLF